MPAIPIITAVAGIAGGINQIRSANQQQQAARDQADLTREQFNWEKQLYEQEQKRKNEAAKRYWGDFNATPELTYEQALVQAGNELNPLYEEQMKTNLQNLGNTLKQRGFYGQLPGDIFTQNAAAKVEAAKNQAVGSLANQLYQTGQQRREQAKQFGLSTFGGYGDEIPETPTPQQTTNNSNSGGNELWKKLLDPAGLFI